jgi:hypothetical protein
MENGNMKQKIMLSLVVAVVLLTVGCNKSVESTSEIATASPITTPEVPVAAVAIPPVQSQNN